MRQKRLFSKSEIKFIVNQYKAGKPKGYIAWALSTADRSIRKILKEQNVATRNFKEQNEIKLREFMSL